MLKRNVVYPMLLLGALLILSVPAFAFAASISISPAGDGNFVVQGSQMEEVTGFHILINYDKNTLSNPRVTLGSALNGKGMSAMNPANPIQIALVSQSAISTSNFTIANIAFDRIGASPALPVLKYTTLDSKNVAQTQTTTPTTDPPVDDSSKTDETTQNTTTPTTNTPTTNTPTGFLSSTPTPLTPPTPTSHPYVLGGTVTLPPDEMLVNDRKQPPAQPAQQENVEYQVSERQTAEPEPEPQADEPRASVPKATEKPVPASKPIQSVLERFRLFQGDKTVKNLAALFNRDSGASFSQSPAIGIADGKAKVILTVSKVAGDTAPNFAFASARFVSLKRIGDGEWEVEVTPDKGAVKAGVTLLSDSSFQEYPLTVAPKADVLLRKTGLVAEADFLLFLKESGTASAPKHDLNGDGSRDYLDDYIFTANYLVKMEEKTNKKKTAQQKGQ